MPYLFHDDCVCECARTFFFGGLLAGAGPPPMEPPLGLRTGAVDDGTDESLGEGESLALGGLP